MKFLQVIAAIFLSFFMSCSSGGSTPENETKNVAMIEPVELSAVLTDTAAEKPAIFNLGPFPELKGAIDIGPGEKEENIAELKNAVKDFPKNKGIVIYCGCCPFDRCPNVFPAMRMLTDMGFTNHQLLNLPVNFKTDWMDKGYPVKQ